MAAAGDIAATRVNKNPKSSSQRGQPKGQPNDIWIWPLLEAIELVLCASICDTLSLALVCFHNQACPDSFHIRMICWVGFQGNQR